MANEDSHSTCSRVSGDEGDSDPLRVAAEARARLSTPAKAYCEQIYLATLVKTQNCTKMLINVTFLYRLYIFASDQIIEERNKKEF